MVSHRMVVCWLGSLLLGVCRAVGAQELVISEVLFDPVGVNTGNQVIEVRNISERSIDLRAEDVWLRFAPAEWRFPTGSFLRSGEVVVIHVNQSGTASSGHVFTGLSGMRNLRASDAVALYRSNLFQDPDKLLHFVQWGAPAQGGEDVAAAADRWPTGGFVDTAMLRAGASVAYRFDAPGSPIPESASAVAAWCVDGSPSIGVANDACTASFARSDVTIQEIGLAAGPGRAHSFVEFRNSGEVLEDLSSLVVSNDGSDSYVFPPGSLLARGERLVLHLGIDGDDSAFEKFTGVSRMRRLGLDDGFAVFQGVGLDDPTRLLEFVQWGDFESPLLSVAHAAGRWPPQGSVDASRLRGDGAIVSLGVSGPAGWAVDNTPTPGLENDAPPAPPLVLINELLVDPLGDNAGHTEIELTFMAPSGRADLGGMTVCVGGVPPACFSFAPGVGIQAREFLIVRLGSLGVDTETVIHTGDFVDLDAGAGEVALFVTPDSDDANNLVQYVRWGAGAGLLGASAEAAGIWPEDATIDSTAVQDDSSIAYLGTGVGPASFRIDRSPSIGAENDENRGQMPYRRGDCNDDGGLDLSDAVSAFNFLFSGGAQPFCENACDLNNDDAVDISDPVFVLNYLFRGGEQPVDPGRDGTCARSVGFSEPSCNAFVSCP